MSQPPPFYRRRWFSFAVGVAVSVACLGGILVRLDFEQLKSAFTTADYRAFPLMIGVVFCLLWLNAWRWTWLLRPMGRFETRETFPPLVIGFAMNNILPARLGELIRVHVFCRRHKSAPMSVLAGVALERVFDIVAIVAFFIVGLSFLPDVDPRIHQSAWVLGGLSLAAFASAGAYVLWTERATRILDAVLQRIPLVSDRLRARLLEWLVHGADGLGVLRDRTLVTKSLLNTLAQWGLAGLQMTIALWSFGVEISPATGCLLVAVVAVGVTVPSAPGYLGVIQALFLLVVNEQTVGVTNASAVFGASVYYHMTQYVLVTFGGLFLLHREGLTVAQTQSVAATSDSPPDAEAVPDVSQDETSPQRRAA